MSLITNITAKEDLLEANSLIITTGMLATLVGTVIAGGVIKLTGPGVGFYLNSLAYIISALCVSSIFYKGSQTLEVKNKYELLFNDIKTGIGYIRRHRLIVNLIMLSSLFAAISSFAYILILNYSTVVLKQGPFGIGIILSCAGLGMICGSLILLKRKERVNYKRALYLPYLIIGLFSLAFIFKPAFNVTSLILFCSGIGISILTIALDTLLQRISPEELKGKIFAARGVLTNGVFLVSLLLVAVLIRFFSARILLGVIGIIALVTSLSIFLADKLWGYQLLRLFLRLVMRILFKFRVSGLENIPKGKRAILAGNHTSLLDGIALMCAYPDRVYFLAAESLFKVKFFGWCAGRLGYIPVKRNVSNKEAIKKAVEILKAGYSIGIFPEGKITEDGRLTEGKAGVAVIAKLAGVDIIPFAIEGIYEAWPLPKKFPAQRFPIEVRFNKPVDISGYPTPEELKQKVMQEIAETKLALEREGYLRVEPDEIIRHLINIG